LKWVFSNLCPEIGQIAGDAIIQLDVVECKGSFYKKLGSKRSDISLIKDSSQCRSTRSTDYRGNNNNREEAY
jgi:hypothetical protein